MKILQIITGFHDGGAEKFLVDLSNELVKEHEVIICSLYDIDEEMFFTKLLSKEIKIVTLGKEKGLDLKTFFKVHDLVIKEKPDVINTHLRALFYMSSIVILKRENIFHTVHNLAEKETTYFFRKLYKIFFNYFNVVPIGISKIVLDSIKKEYGNSFNTLINNGVKQLSVSTKLDNVIAEVNSYKNTKNTKVLLSIGRISEQKNYELMILTVNKLVEEGCDIILLIIGNDHGQLEMLKSIACDRVFFLGSKSNVADYMKCCNAFCMSSVYEGLPIVLLEALSLGCIPVCTPAGGIVDVLHDDVGFLSKDFSENEYYDTMKNFLYAETSIISRKKANCLKSFHNKYSIEVTAKNYVRVYGQRYEKN